MPTTSDPPALSPDQAIAGVAALQHGLITTAQLNQLGVSNSSIAKRVRRGLLHPIHRGVWSVGHSGLSRHGRFLAAVRATGHDAALSHLAAASLWNIWRRPVDSIDVVSSSRRQPIPGIHVHLSRALTAREVRRRERIPVTSVARTIRDLGDVLTPYQLANVIHEAEFRKRFNRRELDRLLVRSRGRGAVTIVRRALEIRDGGSAGTFSELEDTFLALAQAGGLEPLVNVPIDVQDGSLRPDFHWPDAMLIVEVDGGGHARKRSKEEDRGRDARFHVAGWTVMRCRPSEFPEALARVGTLLRAV